MPKAKFSERTGRCDKTRWTYRGSTPTRKVTLQIKGTVSYLRLRHTYTHNTEDHKQQGAQSGHQEP
jgi:hypothetical protein